MHEGRTPVRQTLLASCGLLAVPVLYIPFRLIAQKYNIATTASLDAAGNVHLVDNFAYPFAVLIWPAFAVLCGLLVPYFAKRLGASWTVVLCLMVAAFVLTYLIPWIDEPIGIPGGGLNGFVSWPANRTGMTTPKLSAILCPALFWSGAIVGMIVAATRFRKGNDNA